MPSAQIVGHFRLVALISEGGAAVVHLAEDENIPGRRVALKILKAGGIGPDLDALKREATALATLQHPNIMVVHEIGTSPLGPFVALEYLSGGSLRQHLNRGPLPELEALRVARDVASALRAAHSKNIVHRDIKPANLIFGQSGEIKVGDFGLALRVRKPVGEASGSAGGEDASTVTTIGLQNPRGQNVAGTPGYIAPEILNGSPPSKHADQYAFGLTLHEMLTGHHPHEGFPWPAAMLMGQFKIQDTLPKDLHEIVRRCINQDPADRYAGMDEVARALHVALSRRLSGPYRRRLLWTIGGGLAAVLVVIGAWLAKESAARRRAHELTQGVVAALERGDVKEAISTSIAAYEADPSYLPACVNIGTLAVQHGEAGWAVSYLQKCAATFPGEPVVHYNLGIAKRRSGDLEGAQASLETGLAKAAANSGTTPMILNELGLVLLERGKAQDAIARLEHHAFPRPDTLEGATLQKTLGLAFLADNRPNDAVRSLRSALEGPLTGETKGIVLVNLGRALEAVENDQEAMRAYSRALLEGMGAEIEDAARQGLERLQSGTPQQQP